MDTRLDLKIKNRHKTWEVARKKKDEFIGHRLTGETFAGHDPFELALAYDNEKRAWIYYELALWEAHPDEYTEEEIRHLQEEKERLTKRINALRNRQWPSSRHS